MIRAECMNPGCKHRPLLDEMTIHYVNGHRQCLCPECAKWVGNVIACPTTETPPKVYAQRAIDGVIDAVAQFEKPSQGGDKKDATCG